jgi:hypothetical protein
MRSRASGAARLDASFCCFCERALAPSELRLFPCPVFPFALSLDVRGNVSAYRSVGVCKASSTSSRPPVHCSTSKSSHQGFFAEMLSIRPRSSSNARPLCLTNAYFGQQWRRFNGGLRPLSRTSPDRVVAILNSCYRRRRSGSFLSFLRCTRVRLTNWLAIGCPSSLTVQDGMAGTHLIETARRSNEQGGQWCPIDLQRDSRGRRTTTSTRIQTSEFRLNS